MNLRMLVSASAVLGAITIVAIRPQWVTASGLDFWSIPSLQETLEETEQMNEELGYESEWIGLRIQEKTQLISLLIQNNISFDEVLNRFYQMNIDSPKMMNIVRMTYHTSDDHEATALTILAYVEARDYPSREAKNAVRSRLLRDFQRLFPGMTR